MKIGIDAREIENGVRTGIGRALDVFLEYAGKQDDDVSIVLFSRAVIRRSPSSRARNVVAPPVTTLLWDQAVLPRLLGQEKVDLFYSPYYKVPLAAACPCISTVYDLMYLTFPAYRKSAPLSRLYYTTFGRLLIKKARRIITSSAYSKKEISALYRLDLEKIAVIPLGLPDSFRPADKTRVDALVSRLGIPGDFVLYTGNSKPHKNVGTLICAFALIRNRFPDLTLVLTGPCTEAVRTTTRSAGVEKMVRCLGPVDEENLPALYSGARLFVMPSLYEGFGYPPLEAMACGTPVVCSNATSLPEVVGDAALLCDAREPGPLAEAMVNVLKTPALGQSLREKGFARAAELSGERYAGRLYDLLRQSIIRRRDPPGL